HLGYGGLGTMKNRRALLLMTAGAVALVVVAVPVIADELLGVITKVDVVGKKVTVVEKDTGKEVEVTVPDDTELDTPKGVSKVDLEKLSKFVEKAKEKGKKGASVVVTHKKAVASKIKVAAKKKEAVKSDQ